MTRLALPKPSKGAMLHHIRPRSLAKDLVLARHNVITLCPFCHADVGDRTLVITGDADTGLTVRRVA